MSSDLGPPGPPPTVPVPGSGSWFGPTRIDDPRVYPAAPITLIDAFAAEQAGTGQQVRMFNWKFGDVAIMFALWFFFAIVSSVLIVASANAPAMVRGVVIVLALMLPWLGLAGWPMLLTVLVGNGPRIDLGLRWSWRDIGWGAIYGCLTLIVAVVLGALTTALFGDFDSAAGDLGRDLASNKPVLIAFVITVAIGAPIVEEIAFRGLVFTSLAKFRMMPWLTVVLSSLIFAAFHLEPVRMIMLFGIGAVLAVARWRTGSLTTSITAHMINNFPGALTLLFF